MTPSPTREAMTRTVSRMPQPNSAAMASWPGTVAATGLSCAEVPMATIATIFWASFAE